MRSFFKLTGVQGFEPRNVWTKTRCLTAWRHPNNIWVRFTNFFDCAVFTIAKGDGVLSTHLVKNLLKTQEPLVLKRKEFIMVGMGGAKRRPYLHIEPFLWGSEAVPQKRS